MKAVLVYDRFYMCVRRFRYLRNPRHLCPPGEEVDLLLLVASALAHGDRRDAIRRTWGHPRGLSQRRAKLLFLLGRGDPEDAGSTDILQEDFEVGFHDLKILHCAYTVYSTLKS